MLTVIGGGLAGCEAAWQAANLGVDVVLYEMRPVESTPAHTTAELAELVCSNSLGGNHLTSASGLLKEEMRRLGSLLIAVADETAVPAGSALAVDRHAFSRLVSERIAAHPRITVIREPVDSIPEGLCIIATGPLTSPQLAEEIQRLTGAHDLYFYDAAAPIIAAESLDTDKGFWAGRYGRGGDDYFNCPMNKEEYLSFREALVHAERHEGHIDEPLRFFEGCVPIEELASRGVDTLRFGPLRPVGLVDPATGHRPYAVVQLRKENKEGSLLNLVGFQTRLKWGEQRRVFRMIPALAEAEFVRYGVMHRNTFLNAPRVLRPTYQWRQRDTLFFAGQITGVEGYVESAGSGLIAGLNAALLAKGQKPKTLPPETMLGALAEYITTADPRHFQPMNANFGLLPSGIRVKNRALRKQVLAERALNALDAWLKQE
ncbi:MAG: methylenetetrahydrofolate--tRNA-(uracil(54)-C(5))-methyltransferase (FADH(2)-oxidizing) TrmFO [Firmicutes bacterium]|jgi:methylenetetrahydrofolate--tRNA-(uracil-5-)-methyltransferase|nr:methylenetetrahydrofolate--tRNA-(uracil(54)-C(5))-methyltransferase (FADH(2)-oxidizing) TrmFO [Bacillota bacterium]